MKQVFSGFMLGAGTTADSYASPLSPRVWNTIARFRGEVLAGINGTLRNLVITTPTAPGAGNNCIYTILINGVSSGITCTISDTATQASDLTHSASYSAGDAIALLRSVTGTPSLGSTIISLESEGSTAAQSWYGTTCDTVVSAAAASFNTPWNGSSIWTATADEVPMAAAGSINALFVALDLSPGVGKSYTVLFTKNGVDQDGVGGTVDTRVTIADSATAGNASFTLAGTGTDTFGLKIIPTGTPTARRVDIGVGFTATTDGESQFSAVTATPSASATNYNVAQGYGNAVPIGWGTTESARELAGGPTRFTLKKFYVTLEVAPGAGNTLTLSLRRNGTDPASGPSVTIADAATTGSDVSGAVDITSVDTFAMKSVPVSLPTVGNVKWTLAQFIPTLAPLSVNVQEPVIGGSFF